MKWDNWMAYGIGILATLAITSFDVPFMRSLIFAVGVGALLFGVWHSVSERPEAMLREICTVVALSIFVLGVLAWRDPSILDTPPPDPPAPVCPELEPVVCDCRHAVGLAVAATKHHCANVFDCVNEGRHPDNCTSDCKYCALRRALDLEGIP